MARQGKMHSSPFHVESAQYKYAIEHENEGYPIRSEIIDCDALNIKTKHCTLWNTGHRRCVSYKCIYFNTNLRRATDCTTCAFYFEKRCFHPNCPSSNHVDKGVAQYCCFYYGIGKNRNGYFHIKNGCERITLTRLVKDCKRKIKSKNLYIKQAEEELCSPKISNDTRTYLINKIGAKADERAQVQALLEKYLSRLSSIGGPLEFFQADNIKMKKTHKQKTHKQKR